MGIRPPTRRAVEEIAVSLGLSLDNSDIVEITAMVGDAVRPLAALDRLADHLPEVAYPRTSGRRPHPGENPHNAWYWQATIDGARQGPLAGHTVAIKDNISVAGIPMMNGSSTLEGYVPEVDATVVTRVLDSGGTILGKAHCESFCYFGGSHTNPNGPITNPHDETRTTGGSSSGCAALVASGEARLAIGSDQGGSIRVPSSYCGIVGMKPTHGLVPYTGAMTMDPTIDHLGPMSRTVEDNALLLEVLAGGDGLDPRQAAPRGGNYSSAVHADADGLRVAALVEGFDHPGPAGASTTDGAVIAMLDRLSAAGVSVERASVPAHLDGLAIWAGIAMQGTYAMSMCHDGVVVGGRGYHQTSLSDIHRHWRSQASNLQDNMQFAILLGEYIRQQYGFHYYAKSQNLARRLAASYDEALGRYDALIMPVAPTVAPKIPDAGAARADQFVPGFESLVNTAPFNATGHPALSVPCGEVDGLPVGIMLVGRKWDEAMLYRLASVVERSSDRVEI